MEEYDNCMRIELTYPHPEWKPSDVQYSEEESRFTHPDGTIRSQKRSVFAYESHDERRFIKAFESMSKSNEDERTVSPVTTDEKFKLTAEELSQTWDISLAAAKRTLEVTTQRAVRTVAYPNVERRWPTGDRSVKYKRLDHPVYHDTLMSTVKSKRGNNCSEMYATDFGWSRNFPMKKVSDVHETLDLFLHRYGLPKELVSDGAQAYIGGEFKRKAREAGCFCKLTDPYSPWQNRAEGEIREVKRLAGRWMVKTKSPKRLWDYCIELASIVRSHTAHDIYQLNGQVPETIMTGQTADISFICEFKWYSWLYYHEPTVKAPWKRSCLDDISVQQHLKPVQ
jgi:hypothetical protein